MKNNVEAVKRVVMAGLKILYDDSTKGLLEQMLTDKGPMPQRLAMNAAGLIKIMFEKSKNTIPPDVLPPAAAIMLAEMAKFMRDTGLVQVTEADIRQGISILMDLLPKMFSGQQAQQPTMAQPQPPANAGVLARGA